MRGDEQLANSLCTVGEGGPRPGVSAESVRYRSSVFSSFYGTFSTIAFTILGLWMFVAQARFREWMQNPDQYRRASAVSTQFAAPGLMSLLALMNSDSELLWRGAFAATSVAAILVLLALGRRPGGTPRGANEVANWIAMAMFAVIAAVAAWPDVVDWLGLKGQYRTVEFFFFSMLLLDGLVIAWTMLFAEVPPVRTRVTAGTAAHGSQDSLQADQ